MSIPSVSSSRADSQPSWSMPAPAIVVPASARVMPAGCSCGGTGGACACQGGAAASAGAAAATPVYAFGTLRMTYPSKSLEAEMKLALASMHAASEPGVIQYFNVNTGYGLQLLGQGQYDYLLRDACFILSIGKIDAYLVQARSYPELYAMVAATNQQSTPVVYSAVIGPLGPIAGPNVCNGLQLPILYCDQIFSIEPKMLNDFWQATIDEQISQYPSAPSLTQDQKQKLASSLAQLLLQMTDNMGTSPEHRALNYVALRYPLIYGIAAQMYQEGYRLVRVEATPAISEGERDVVFVYQRLAVGQVTQWRCSIDVSGQYPFITRRLSQSYPARPLY